MRNRVYWRITSIRLSLGFLYAAILSWVIALGLSSCGVSGDTARKPAGTVLGKTSWPEWVAATGWEVPRENPSFPPEKLQRLKMLTEKHDAHFLVFASSTCEECREHVPRLFQVFEAAAVDSSRVTLVGLDDALREPTGAYARFDIPSTPCVFVMRGESVIGRIAYPDFRWLNGLIRILEAE